MICFMQIFVTLENRENDDKEKAYGQLIIFILLFSVLIRRIIINIKLDIT